MAQRVKSYGIITLGALIYALAFDAFVAPNRFAMGGLTGLAQIINALVPALPVGVTVFVMNVPLFILGVRKMGLRLLVSSICAMTFSIASTGTATSTASAPCTHSCNVELAASAIPMSTALSTLFVERSNADTISNTPPRFMAHAAEAPIKPTPIKAKRIVKFPFFAKTQSAESVSRNAFMKISFSSGEPTEIRMYSGSP